MNEKNFDSYNSQDIEVLEGLEAVRKRPGMYIGSTDSDGMHHMFSELLGNSIDEHSSGFGNIINIKIENDLLTIEDFGRGMPFDLNVKHNKSALELILTVLHSGGKFNNSNYQFSSGLHGVGLSVVNALSKHLKVTSYRGKKTAYQIYSLGKPLADLVETSLSQSKYGTKIEIIPDDSIMSGVWDEDIIVQKCFEMTCLNTKLSIIIDFNGNIHSISKNNLLSMMPKKDSYIIENIHFFLESEKIYLDFVFNYSNDNKSNTISFVNNVITPDSGTHVNIVKNTIIKFFTENNKSKIKFEASDFKKGLNLIVNFKINDPIFSGQTKTKLSSNLSSFNLQDKILKFLSRHFLEKHFELKILFEFFKNNSKQRELLEVNKFDKNKDYFIDSGTLPGKLADCSNSNIEDREVFLVEGDSAGGTAKTARDRFSQAVLSLQGKFLNAGKHDFVKLKKNTEIDALVTALGLSYNINDISKIRYGRMIIFSDRDADGGHIQNLYLIFFFKYFREIIEAGRLYIAIAPLYGYKTNTNSQIEKFFFTKESLDEFLATKSPNHKYFLQRYKGLGEMNADELEISMNPKTRYCLKVSIKDFEKSSLMMNNLMGLDSKYRKTLTEDLFSNFKDFLVE